MSILKFYPAGLQTILFLLLCAGAFPVYAASEPVEITAQDVLEWDRGGQKYIARGQAVVRQGELSIHADVLTAEYDDPDAGGKPSEIKRLTAQGHVVIKAPDGRALGDHAVYVPETDVAILTGEALRLETRDQVLTARDRIEYDVNAGRMVAEGDATVLREDGKRLRADRVLAFFADRDGKQELERLEAHGSVIITTPTETISGNKGVYFAKTEQAELSGNVRIKRDKNLLKGEKASVDLKTGVSRLFGGSGPVQGVFYPGSDAKSLDLGGGRE